MSRAKLFLLLFIILLFPLSFVFASSQLEIVINEVAWMGTEIGWRYEWIELYNNSNQEIDITNWEIENSEAKKAALKISKGKIPANGFFIICKTQIEKCDLRFSKLSLHNEYENNGKLILRDEQGNIIDKTPDTNDKKWPAGDNETKQTMERKNPLLSGNDVENWQTSQDPGGTLKAKNSLIETEIPKEKDITISLEKEIILAKIEENIPKSSTTSERSNLVKMRANLSSPSLFTFLIALGIAIASAIIVLILKKRIRSVL